MAQDPAPSDISSISKLKTPKLLSDKLSQLRRQRTKQEIEWKLNLAFYKGDQYTYYNRSADRIDRVPTEEGSKPRYRVRLVSNQIQPGVESSVAKLTKTKPIYAATPGSASANDFKAAQMAERLLDYWWDEFHLNAKRDEAIRWGRVGGQGFWKISWDPHANKALRFMLDPEGQPITNEALKELYRAELEQVGVKAEEQVVYLGDIKVEVMSPFDVFLDPTAKVFADCKYAICVHYLDPDEIKARWGVDVKADHVPASPDTSLPVKDSDGSEDPSVKAVYVGYFLPTPAMPDGRYVVWTDGLEKPLQDMPWPYPFQTLPLVKFPGTTVPGAVYDDAVVSQVRSLQKEFNRTASQILEFKNMTVRPQWTAPVGSLRQRMTSEPGAVWEYVPVAGFKPEPLPLSNLPSYIFETLNDLAVRIKDHFGLNEITEGSQLPSHMDSGIAVDLMQEMATDRLAPTVLLIEEALGRAGQLMLGFAQEYYREERLLKIKGQGGSVSVVKFTQADIDSGIDIRVEAGSGLPRTRAGKQARIMDMIDKGLIPPHVGMKHMDVADLGGVAAMLRSDEEHASREHDKLMRGVPLNPSAVQLAMQAVNQGINPSTGEQLQDMNEAQQVLMEAALSPGPLDNHEQHVETHGLYIKSVEFEALPPEVQQRYLQHAQMHMQALQQPPQPVEPRVSYNIKGTMGPSGSSKILERAGVDITPQEAMEPPLETWVSDSMDKPDMDEAGNDPLTEMDQAQQVAMSAMKATGDELRTQQTHALDVEAKQASIAKQQADAEFARKRASQGPPKSSGG